MKSNKSLQSIILSEKLESPAQQQSHETYLIPRNCWIKITSLQIKPSQLDKNQKLRIRISVPNSARVVRTSPIQLEDSFLSTLQNAQNQAGFSEMKLDIKILLEYKHDVRVGHQNNLDFDVESLSPVISRSKTLGSTSVDLSQVIQKPMQNNLILRKDNDVTSLINLEIYSLCLSKNQPPIQLTNNSITTYNSDSDSESELPFVTAHFEKTISDLFKTNHLLILDDKSPQGQKFHHSTSMSDIILPINELQVVQLIFNIAEQEFVPSHQNPFLFFIAGDDFFTCNVLKEFVTMRDKFLLQDEMFHFIHIPLVQTKNHFARKISYIYNKCNQNSLVSNTNTNSTSISINNNNNNINLNLNVLNNLNNNNNNNFVVNQISDSDSAQSDSSSNSSESDSSSNSFSENNESSSGVSSYDSHFLTDDWFNLFVENSSIQNSSSLIDSEIKYLLEAPLNPVNIFIADVLISTMKDQFNVPMFCMLEIGKLNTESKKSNIFHLKSNLLSKSGNKSHNLKFNYLYILTTCDSSLNAVWTEVSSSSSTQKKKKKTKLMKMVLSVSKSHKEPFDVKIDDADYSNVMNLAITPRNAKFALKMFVPTSKGKK